MKADEFELEIDRQIKRMWDKSQENKDPTGKRFEEGIVQGFEIAKTLYNTRTKTIFESKLRALCIAYDNENGAYPENELEGLSVYEFFTQNGIKDASTFNNEFAEQVWKASDEWSAQGLKL